MMTALVPLRHTSPAFGEPAPAGLPASAFLAQVIGDLMTAAGRGAAMAPAAEAARRAYARQAVRAPARRT